MNKSNKKNSILEFQKDQIRHTSFIKGGTCTQTHTTSRGTVVVTKGPCDPNQNHTSGGGGTSSSGTVTTSRGTVTVVQNTSN